MWRQLVLLLGLLILSGIAPAQVNLPGDNPAQFVSFWKSSVINAADDESVAFAERIFQRLLRGWESSRLEPGLYVVDSEQGPWAVSLVDGNILLSRQAISSLMKFGQHRAEHLLAFVLAHELAHQKADDLWQHRFFRQSPLADQDMPLTGLQMDQRLLQQMEQKEIRADYDGLLLMASVGFDPQQIVSGKDFFTQWVESIWRQPCAIQQDRVISAACEQARKRAQRTKAQLNSLASQASLYQLGVQSMVAGDYENARYYFSLFGRDYPSRAVMSAIGSTHLAQAMEVRRELIELGAMKGVDFYFPLVIDATAGMSVGGTESSGETRSASNRIAALQKNLEQHVGRAVSYFEKAIRLAPENRKAFRHLISSYLVAGNVPMARGILQGRYVPGFGEDGYAALFSAMIRSLEDDHPAAIDVLREQTEKLDGSLDQVLVYSLFHNLVSLLEYSGDSGEGNKVWQRLARLGQKRAQPELFQLGLAKINPGLAASGVELKVAPDVNGLRIGDRKTRDDSAHTISELWIEGDPYHVYHYENGAQFITGRDGKIVSARQQSGSAAIGRLKIGDDASNTLKTLGLPDRRQYLVSGEYLAYDAYGLAVQLDQGEVKGWFLY